MLKGGYIRAGIMTKVFFVRHAEPNYENHDDRSRELSPCGMEE